MEPLGGRWFLGVQLQERLQGGYGVVVFAESHVGAGGVQVGLGEVRVFALGLLKEGQRFVESLCFEVDAAEVAQGFGVSGLDL